MIFAVRKQLQNGSKQKLTIHERTRESKNPMFAGNPEDFFIPVNAPEDKKWIANSIPRKAALPQSHQKKALFLRLSRQVGLRPSLLFDHLSSSEVVHLKRSHPSTHTWLPAAQRTLLPYLGFALPLLPCPDFSKMDVTGMRLQREECLTLPWTEEIEHTSDLHCFQCVFQEGFCGPISLQRDQVSSTEVTMRRARSSRTESAFLRCSVSHLESGRCDITLHSGIKVENATPLQYSECTNAHSPFRKHTFARSCSKLQFVEKQLHRGPVLLTSSKFAM